MKRERARSSSYSVWLIIFIGIVTTSYFAYLIHHNAHKEIRLRFEFEADQILEHVKDRMNQYETALIQTRAYLLSKRNVTKEEFHNYFENTYLIERYPGIQGLGFTKRIHATELNDHIREIRKTNPHYNVWPEVPREEYYSIIYIEPMDWRNKKAIGYDMFTEPIRRMAMEKARDLASSVLSSRVILMQEQRGSVLPGFNFYLPVYAKNAPVETVEQRRAALVGFLFSPFRTPELFKHILAETTDGIDIKVYIGQSPEPENELFDSRKNGEKGNFNIQRTIFLKNNILTFLFAANQYFPQSCPLNNMLLVILGGLIFTALLLKIFIINEMQIIQKESSEKELRKAVTARDEFLSIASHELKTPLTSLKLLNQIYQKKLQKQEVMTPESLKSVLKQSETQINRIVRLVDDMLDLSRVQSGKLSYNFQDMELADLVREVYERFKEHFDEKGCELNLSELQSAKGSFDKDRLEQVLVNLLTNALRYGNRQPVNIELRNNGQQALLKVADNGIGLSDENFERIFQRFERVISANEVSGLGIGLYITRQIVEAHRGKIWVESEIGKGSTFYVELPLLASPL